MKSFSQFTENKIVIEKKPLVEASILKPDYVIGHKFLYKGGIKEFDKEGFKHGDIFTAVKPTKKAIFIGSEDEVGTGRNNVIAVYRELFWIF